MNEQQKQLIQAGQQIIQAAQQGDQQATQIVQAAQSIAQDQQQLQQLQQAVQQGDQQAMMIYAVLVAASQQQTQSAKLGAKLNYIKSLRGICPEGYEMQYFKKGGQLCKKCMKKMEQGGDTESVDPITAFKCGGKKTKKKENGGEIDNAKCGKKLKKKEEGGNIDLAKCGKKMIKKNACGNKVKIDKCGGKTKKITKAEDGTKTKIAQKAEERYDKGKVWGPLGQTRSNGVTLTTVTSSAPVLYTPAIIQEKVTRDKYGVPVDTTYSEAPRHLPFVNVTTRQAKNTDYDRTEYEILKRRFNTAKSVAK